jgi:hypothetical protein
VDPGEWTDFKRKFQRRCHKWDNRFWLIPPGDFSLLDVNTGHQRLRPNVHCHLHVDLVGSAADAHQIIDVVNLDKKPIAAKLGVKESKLDGQTFRSNMGLYDSLDVDYSVATVHDKKSRLHHVRHNTVLHEIGHALGLPHIGVTHHDPLCSVALVFDLPGTPLIPSPAVPALYKGGSNAPACYGEYVRPRRGANVMGFGTIFEKSNAQPWRDRIALHTGTSPETWQVSMRKVPPRIV